jgi:hypothetical protein
MHSFDGKGVLRGAGSCCLGVRAAGPRQACKGEAAGGLAGNTADGRQAGEGATHCRTLVHPCRARHGTRTASRGPTSSRAVGILDRQPTKGSTRGR